MRKLLRRLFTARPKPEWTELQAAKFFRTVVGNCAFLKHPMTLTITCNGFETSVGLSPKDNLTRYLFEWAQGICFQLSTDGVASTEAYNHSPALDPEIREEIETYMKFWVSLMAKNGEFPVLLISRRESSGRQRMIVTPGYEPDILKEFLRTAIQQTDTLHTDIEIVHS